MVPQRCDAASDRPPGACGAPRPLTGAPGQRPARSRGNVLDYGGAFDDAPASPARVARRPPAGALVRSTSGRSGETLQVRADELRFPREANEGIVCIRRASVGWVSARARVQEAQ